VRSSPGSLRPCLGLRRHRHVISIARLGFRAKNGIAAVYEGEKPHQQLRYSARLYMPWVSAAATVEA
jgi:hypothetical protein